MAKPRKQRDYKLEYQRRKQLHPVRDYAAEYTKRKINKLIKKLEVSETAKGSHKTFLKYAIGIGIPREELEAYLATIKDMQEGSTKYTLEAAQNEVLAAMPSFADFIEDYPEFEADIPPYWYYHGE